jgi:hypothetical protein
VFVYAPTADDPRVVGTYAMPRSAKTDSPDGTCTMHVTDDAAQAERWHASLLRGELPNTDGPKRYLHEATSQPPLSRQPATA